MPIWQRPTNSSARACVPCASNAGLTQEEVAERAGMATSTLSRLESGARRLALDHLTPLAGALGVEVGDLLAPATRRPPRPRAARGSSTASSSASSPSHVPGGLVVAHLDFPAARKTPDPAPTRATSGSTSSPAASASSSATTT